METANDCRVKSVFFYVDKTKPAKQPGIIFLVIANDFRVKSMFFRFIKQNLQNKPEDSLWKQTGLITADYRPSYQQVFFLKSLPEMVKAVQF